MEKIIIRYIGNDPGYKIGTLALECPFNNPEFYDIVKENDIARYNTIIQKKTVEDRANGVIYCFCNADGNNVVFIRKGGYTYDENKKHFSLT